MENNGIYTYYIYIFVYVDQSPKCHMVWIKYLMLYGYLVIMYRCSQIDIILFAATICHYVYLDGCVRDCGISSLLMALGIAKIKLRHSYVQDSTACVTTSVVNHLCPSAPSDTVVLTTYIPCVIHILQVGCSWWEIDVPNAWKSSRSTPVRIDTS